MTDQNTALEPVSPTVAMASGTNSEVSVQTTATLPENSSSALRTVSSMSAGPSGIYDDSRIAKEWDDATWILTSSFIIFTMQSGFGMLESGCVSHKNEVNIMMKNVADVIFGGISYWMLGYGFSFGTDWSTNGFCGLGKFFLDPADDESMGVEYSRFVFQASFATTATTIVSGAVAERAKFTSYLVFSFFNTFIYCFPAHWVWARSGWLRDLGVVDVAGDGPVHLVGGISALIAAAMIKPRKGRFTDDDHHEMESPVGAVLGLFILWWSWLAFNCGSTYGISGGKWKVASRAATNTLMSANSGGIVAFLSSYVVHKKFHVHYVINGIMASLVSITACCAVTSVKESLVIGGMGALLTLLADAVMERLKIDDPVSAFAVHGVGGTWGLLATGLFAHKDNVAQIFNDRDGLVAGGGFYLLGVQTLEILSIGTWTAATSYVLLKIIDMTIGLRLTPEEEEIGADFIEHNVIHRFFKPKPLPESLPLTSRGMHVNLAYGIEDETASESPVVFSGRPLVFTTIASNLSKDTSTQNGHCVQSHRLVRGRSETRTRPCGNKRAQQTHEVNSNELLQETESNENNFQKRQDEHREERSVEIHQGVSGVDENISQDIKDNETDVHTGHNEVGSVGTRQEDVGNNTVLYRRDSVGAVITLHKTTSVGSNSRVPVGEEAGNAVTEDDDQSVKSGDAFEKDCSFRL